ncbi:MAG: hypothetical protein LBQ66_16280 [Planctomycetaceae bacterium]|jgi:hypothetical protein|nr:hypothetical protein [Planctomycetaceae bacterium]
MKNLSGKFYFGFTLLLIYAILLLINSILLLPNNLSAQTGSNLSFPSANGSPNYPPNNSSPQPITPASPLPPLPAPLPPNFFPPNRTTQPNNNPTTTQPQTEQNQNTTPKRTTTIEREKHDSVILFNTGNSHSVVLPGDWSVDVLEEFARFITRDENIAPQNYTINKITAQGKLTDQKIESTILLSITTISEKTIKIPLNLKEGILPPTTQTQNQKQQPYQYTGNSNFFLTVDPTNGQYVAVISPKIQNNNPTTPKKSEQYHEIKLNLWFPTTKLTDGRRRLSISFPQAVSSQFILTIPTPNIIANTNQDTLLDTTQTNNGNNTQFTLLGLKPNFDITWRKKNIEQIENRPVIEIKDASIIAQLDPRFIAYDATLPIRCLQNSFDKFLIRLPKEAALDTENSEKFATNNGYSIRTLSTEELNTLNKQHPHHNNQNNNTNTNQTTIIEIQTPQKISGTLNVRLLATRRFTQPTTTTTPAATPQTNEWNDIEGFEVIGAQRQYGTLSITVPDGLRPNWRAVRGINRIDPTNNTTQTILNPPTTPTPETTPTQPPQTAINNNSNSTQFRFTLQPFLLRGQIISPQVRTNIKPEYQVNIAKNTVSMTARFVCSVPGSNSQTLRIQLFDWQWNGKISPANIVNVGGIELNNDGILNIPVSNIVDDEFEIELNLHRQIDSLPKEAKPDSAQETDPITEQKELTTEQKELTTEQKELTTEQKELVLRFPQPQASWVEPSVIAVIPADNIDIFPVSSSAKTEPRSSGLTRINRRTADINIDLPQRQREPLIYQSNLPDPILVAKIEPHDQELRAEINTNVRLLASNEQVTETVTYDVAYEPVDRLDFEVPRSLDAHGTGEYGGIQVFIGSTFLRLRDVAATSKTDEQKKDEYVKKFIILPEAMIGKFNLGIQYSLPPINVTKDLSASVLLPFVKPTNAKINSHKVNIFAPAGVNTELHDESKPNWKNNGTITQQQINTEQNNNTTKENLTDNKNKTTTNKSRLQLLRTTIFESTAYNHKTEIDKHDNNTTTTNTVERDPVDFNADMRDDLGAGVNVDLRGVGDVVVVDLLRRDPYRLHLLVSAGEHDIFGLSMVERSWVQTWLTDTVRVDRAVYLINTSRDVVVIKLPERVVAGKVAVKKGGESIPVELSAGLELSIPMLESENGRLIPIEVWYQVAGNFRNKIQLSFPQFDNEVLVRRAYWQLILSPNRHILFLPEGWISEYRQTYNSLFVRRKPLLVMGDVGISGKIVEDVVIPDNASQFLFSSISPPELTEFVVVGRPVLVLLSSSVVLFVGLLLIYFPKVRYIGSVFVLCVSFFAALFYSAVSALLFLQAASIGVVLALVAGYVYWLCYREKQWIFPQERSRASEEVYSVIVDDSSHRTHDQNNPKSATIIKQNSM